MKEIYKKPIIEVFESDLSPVLYETSLDKGDDHPTPTAKGSNNDWDDYDIDLESELINFTIISK